MRSIALCAAVAILGCGGGGGSAPEPIALEEQPTITDGIRETFSLALDALAASDRPAALTRAVRTLRLRLQLAHVRAHVSVDDQQQLVVDLAPLDPDAVSRATDLVMRRGQLEFRPVLDGTPLMEKISNYARHDRMASEAEIVGDRDRWTVAEDTDPHLDWMLRAPDRDQVVSVAEAKVMGCMHAGPRPDGTVLCKVTGRRAIETYLAAQAQVDRELAIPADRQLVFERYPAGPEARDQRVFWRSYLVERRPAALTGAAVARATVKPPNPDLPDTTTIWIELDAGGRDAFAALTTQHVGGKIATILDGTVASAPIINGPIRGGALALTVRDPVDARELAIVLSSGALPGPMLLEYRGKLVGGVPQAEPTD